MEPGSNIKTASGKNFNKDFMKKRKMKDNIMGYIFLAPALICFIFFIGGPIILSAILSFFSYNLIQAPVFAGLENIKRMSSDSLVIGSFKNTFKFLLILSPMHCILGLVLAYFVHRVKRLQFFFRSVIYFPTIVTTASVAIAWAYIFSTDFGVINYFIRFFGGENIPWLTNSFWVYVTIALFSFWKFIGTTFLYYFIGLQNIPDVYYEAAQIDGAGSFRTFFNISLPLLTPTMFFVFVINVIGVIQIFDEPFLLTRGGPGRATMTVAYGIYERAILEMKIGYGITISFVLFLIILCITFLQFAGQRKWVNYDYE